MQLIPILVSLASTLPGRIMVALGIGWVTYAGLGAVVSTIVSGIQAQFSGIGAQALQVLTLAGVPQAAGIICGAYTARAALMTIPHLGKISP
jgi:hypothetical protein